MFNAYATKAAKQRLEPFTYEPAALTDSQIEIKIDYCGICHSDIHLIDNDWGISNYPLVPGHEIIGRVTRAGKDSTRFKEGQLVGVGWQSGSCGHCEWCNHALENLCAGMQSTCVSGFGGYADYFRVAERFAVPIPEGLDLAAASPLLCGGVTVYSPFRLYDIRPAMKVGVIGIGGLGHLALQYAAAWGCEVYAFSGSPAKEAESKQLGAHHFIDTGNKEAMASVAGKLDFILSTVSADVDWNPYFTALRPRGKLVIVGVAPHGVTAPSLPLILGEKMVGGSWIGSPFVIEEMFEFSKRHNIVSAIEEFPMSRVNDALDRVRSNQMRYRVVLKADF